MPNPLIASLLEALAVSPDNTPLRSQIVQMLIDDNDVDRAAPLAQDGLSIQPASTELKLALAKCFLKQAKPSAAIVLLEEAIKHPNAPDQARLLLAQALYADGDHNRARAIYQTLLDRDPSLEDEALSEALGINTEDASAFEDAPESFSEGGNDVDETGRVRMYAETPENSLDLQVENPGIDFDDVGGMDDLKKQIDLKIIAPIKNADLYKAYGKAIGGGILMYGPPGCGKTHLARATAGQVNASFLSIGIHDVMDMWVGNSEKKLHAVFEFARSNQPCVLFFDEVDALAASRSQMQGSAARNIINQFLAELDGIKDQNDGLLILAATNAPWHLDNAFRRPGRFDRVLFVPPPDEPGRASVLEVLLKDKPQQDIDPRKIASKCAGFSGADMKAVVDRAIEDKLEEAIKTGIPAPLTTKDLLKSAKAVKPSTKEWFATAKNHALYANEGGVYDDVLAYMKLQ